MPIGKTQCVDRNTSHGSAQRNRRRTRGGSQDPSGKHFTLHIEVVSTAKGVETTYIISYQLHYTRGDDKPIVFHSKISAGGEKVTLHRPDDYYRDSLHCIIVEVLVDYIELSRWIRYIKIHRNTGWMSGDASGRPHTKSATESSLRLRALTRGSISMYSLTAS